MKKELTVKEKIGKVLMENANGFLSLEEIAEIAYGSAYVRPSKPHYNGLIKRNMDHAIALLSKLGFTVVKDLEPTVKSSSLSFKRVLGYKIADKEDIEAVRNNLQTKKERLEIASDNKDNFELLASKNNLLIE